MRFATAFCEHFVNLRKSIDKNQANCYNVSEPTRAERNNFPEKIVAREQGIKNEFTAAGIGYIPLLCGFCILKDTM